MQNVKNLQVAERAKTLAVLIYRTTGEFPSTERFGLTAQMRRAALSIGSNIAEGCGREGDRELARFVQIAMGSASELDFQCELAELLEFGSAQALADARVEVQRVKRMLSRLIVALRPHKVEE